MGEPERQITVDECLIMKMETRGKPGRDSMGEPGRSTDDIDGLR
jgi:hypothetical protein